MLLGEAVAFRQKADVVAERSVQDWELTWLENRAEAEQHLSDLSIDAIIIQAEREGADPVELIDQKANQNTRVLQFVWCPPKDMAFFKGRFGASAHCLSSEWEPDRFESALRNAFLRDGLRQSIPLKTLLSRIGEVPRLPQMYVDIIQHLESPDSDLEFVAQMIASDVSACALLLKAANSAYHGCTHPVANAFEAVLTLGVEQTKATILFGHMLTRFDPATCRAFLLDELWHHSLATASFARSIAQKEAASPTMADEAYTAGLLQDIGTLILATNLSKEYGRVLVSAQQQLQSLRTAEQNYFGTTHAELGACLISQWELPFAIAEAVAWHHAPGSSENNTFSPLTAVHVADAFFYENQVGLYQQHDGVVGEPMARIDSHYLSSMGKQNRISYWRGHCPVIGS